MNSRTARLFRQVKADEDWRISQRSDILRVEWDNAPSAKARGRVNKQLRAIVTDQRVKHAAKMKLLQEATSP